MIEAKIIADSINTKGDRCTSFVCVFPRIILAEVNTHRSLSRNSASSRAVPFETMLKKVQENPFVPYLWMKEHKGMQGNKYFEENKDISRLTVDWLNAKDKAIESAKILSQAGLTKQICNRLLEPFMYHTAIITATEYDNFYALRCAEGTEIHFQELAYKMLNAANESTPKKLFDLDWHIPFGDNIKVSETGAKLKIATARCARVSYINYEGKDDYEADYKLFKTLETSKHMSPFEHCAQAESELGFCGNFKGFRQLRKLIEGENQTTLLLNKY